MTVNKRHKQMCVKCSGKGDLRDRGLRAIRCPACKGEGWKDLRMPEEKSVSVDLLAIRAQAERQMLRK